MALKELHPNGYAGEEVMLGSKRDVTALEVLGLLLAACDVAGNTLMLFSIKDNRKMPVAMRILLGHLAVVYLFVGFFGMKASAYNLINKHGASSVLCYVRVASLQLLQNVAAYSTLWLLLCCQALARPSGRLYRPFLGTGKRVGWLCAATWLFVALFVSLAFTVERSEWGGACDLLRGYSRTLCSAFEGFTLLLLVLGLTAHAWSHERRTRSVSTTVADPNTTSQFAHVIESWRLKSRNTLLIISILFIVTTAPTVGFRIYHALKSTPYLSDAEYVIYVIAYVTRHFNGALLFPVILWRHKGARRSCWKALGRKWDLGNDLSRRMDDNYSHPSVFPKVLLKRIWQTRSVRSAECAGQKPGDGACQSADAETSVFR